MSDIIFYAICDEIAIKDKTKTKVGKNENVKLDIEYQKAIADNPNVSANEEELHYIIVGKAYYSRIRQIGAILNAPFDKNKIAGLRDDNTEELLTD